MLPIGPIKIRDVGAEKKWLKICSAGGVLGAGQGILKARGRIKFLLDFGVQKHRILRDDGRSGCY